MKKNKVTIPETEHSKLISMLSMFEKVLHPDLFLPIIQQAGKAYEEAREQAYRDAGISQEARDIERIMKEFRADISRYDHSPHTVSFLLKQAFKKFLLLYKNNSDGKQ